MTRIELPFPVPLHACSVEGCERPRANRNKLCWAHYNRLRKHGDIMADVPVRSRAANGEPLRYFEETVLTYEGDECLKWPFTTTAHGYGTVWSSGRFQLVSRLVCERTHGSPPSPKHEAAHSCGKGHESCVTKNHLSWKTTKENSADKLAHGTKMRGESHPTAKLKASDVAEIKAMRGVVPHRQLAERFGVSISHISRIQSGRAWRD